jgi:Icc-related predicted phosphoesterase
VGLKQKANEEELKSLQESKLKSLEQQIRVLRVECMKIRGHCDNQEKVIFELKNKKMELEDDRRFLDFEIRDCR